MFVARRFRLYPTATQEVVLRRHIDTCRALWNLALEQRQMAWRYGRHSVSAVEQCRDLKEARNDPVVAPWLAATPAQVLQQVLRDLDRAYARWWSGQNRAPRFRARAEGGSFVEAPGSRVRQKSGLNRAILDVGWAQIVALTQFKAVRRGSTVVKVNPACTSQTCPDCGHVDPAQRVTRSRYECRQCGETSWG